VAEGRMEGEEEGPGQGPLAPTNNLFLTGADANSRRRLLTDFAAWVYVKTSSKGCSCVGLELFMKCGRAAF